MQSTTTTERFTWPVGFLLAVICCFLLMTPASQVTKKANMDASVRITTMTLAVAGISNPVSTITQFIHSERSPFRPSGKRVHGTSIDAENSMPCALAASSEEIPLLFLHVTPLSPARFLPGSTSETLTWYALAPPASSNS